MDDSEYPEDKDMEAARSLKLYEIVGKLEEIEAALLDSGGEIDEATESALDTLEGALEDKVQRICLMRQNLSREADKFKAEIDRLAAREKTLRTSADSLKRYLHVQLDRSGRASMEAGTFRLRIQANTQPSVSVGMAAADLPPRFQRVTVEANRKALLEAWRSEEALPPAVEIMVGHHLRIR